MSSVIFVDFNDVPDSKMGSCQFRSKDKLDGFVTKCCGQSNKISAFKCDKRDIYPLDNNICNNCEVYEKIL